MFSDIHGLASWLAHSKYIRFGGYFYYSGTNKPGFTRPGRRYFNGILAETVEAKMQNWVRSVTIYFFLSSGSLFFFFFPTPKNAISHSWLSVCSPFRPLPTLPLLVKFNKWGISWNRWPCIFWLKLGKQEIPSGQSWSLSSSTHLGTFPWTGRGSGFCLKSYSALGDPGRICMQPHSPLNWGDMRLRKARLSPGEPRPNGHMGCQHCQRCIVFIIFLVFQNGRNRGLEWMNDCQLERRNGRGISSWCDSNTGLLEIQAPWPGSLTFGT